MRETVYGLTLVIVIGAMLTTSTATGSVLAAGNATKATNMTAGNATKATNMTAGNATKAGNATTNKVLTNVSKSVGGGLKGLGAMMSSPNNTKTAGKVLTNISQAIGGGLKGLGNLLSPGKK